MTEMMRGFFAPGPKAEEHIYLILLGYLSEKSNGIYPFNTAARAYRDEPLRKTLP